MEVDSQTDDVVTNIEEVTDEVSGRKPVHTSNDNFEFTSEQVEEVSTPVESSAFNQRRHNENKLSSCGSTMSSCDEPECENKVDGGDSEVKQIYGESDIADTELMTEALPDVMVRFQSVCVKVSGHPVNKATSRVRSRFRRVIVREIRKIVKYKDITSPCSHTYKNTDPINLSSEIVDEYEVVGGRGLEVSDVQDENIASDDVAHVMVKTHSTKQEPTPNQSNATSSSKAYIENSEVKQIYGESDIADTELMTTALPDVMVRFQGVCVKVSGHPVNKATSRVRSRFRRVIVREIRKIVKYKDITSPCSHTYKNTDPINLSSEIVDEYEVVGGRGLEVSDVQDENIASDDVVHVMVKTHSTKQVPTPNQSNATSSSKAYIENSEVKQIYGESDIADTELMTEALPDVMVRFQGVCVKVSGHPVNKATSRVRSSFRRVIVREIRKIVKYKDITSPCSHTYKNTDPINLSSEIVDEYEVVRGRGLEVSDVQDENIASDDVVHVMVKTHSTKQEPTPNQSNATSSSKAYIENSEVKQIYGESDIADTELMTTALPDVMVRFQGVCVKVSGHPVNKATSRVRSRFRRVIVREIRKIVKYKDITSPCSHTYNNTDPINLSSEIVDEYEVVGGRGLEVSDVQDENIASNDVAHVMVKTHSTKQEPTPNQSNATSSSKAYIENEPKTDGSNATYTSKADVESEPTTDGSNATSTSKADGENEPTADESTDKSTSKADVGNVPTANGSNATSTCKSDVEKEPTTDGNNEIPTIDVGQFGISLRPNHCNSVQFLKEDSEDNENEDADLISIYINDDIVFVTGQKSGRLERLAEFDTAETVECDGQLVVQSSGHACIVKYREKGTGVKRQDILPNEKVTRRYHTDKKDVVVQIVETNIIQCQLFVYAM